MPPRKDAAATNKHLLETIESLQNQRAELALSLRKTLEPKESQTESTKPSKGKARDTVAASVILQNSGEQSTHEDNTADNQAVDVPQASEMENSTNDEGVNDAKEILEAAKGIVKRHIELLHSYNEIRDVGQGLLGLIAEARGARVVDLYNEFGLNDKD